jgi:thiamine-phosphate diphosphorylase
VTLPRLLVLTDRSQCAGPLVEAVAIAVRCGARALVLREKDLPEDERDRLAAQLGELLAPVGGLLIRTGRTAGGDAVHLAAADAFPQPRPSLVGRSCHDGGELRRAREEGCDYATISPVFPSASKPGYGPALGLDGLAAVAAAGPPPYALGGVDPRDVRGCLAAGAHGVAVMGAIMRDPELTGAYLAELKAVPA